MNKTVKFEESAELITVSGWACKVCHRFWNQDERMARWCCSTEQPCECGNRISKHEFRCETCQQKEKWSRWYSAERRVVEWSGKFPVALFDDDVYFWDRESLIDHVHFHAADSTADRLEFISRMWLTTCEPNNGGSFGMSDFLQDHLPDDADIDDSEINKIVNDWIERHAPFSWYMTGDRIRLTSLIPALIGDM